MIQAAKIIAIGLATTGLIGALVGAALIYLPYIIGVTITITLLMLVFITLNAMEMPGMPGVRCPVCASRGIETWVLPGKHCRKCGCACDW